MWGKRLVSRGAFVAVVALAGCDADDEPRFGDVVLLVTGGDVQADDTAIADRFSMLIYETRTIDGRSLSSTDVEAEDVGFVYVGGSVSSGATLDAVRDTARR